MQRLLCTLNRPSQDLQVLACSKAQRTLQADAVIVHSVVPSQALLTVDPSYATAVVTWSVEEARREPSERAPSCSPSDSPCFLAVASNSEVPPSCQADTTLPMCCLLLLVDLVNSTNADLMWRLGGQKWAKADVQEPYTEAAMPARVASCCKSLFNTNQSIVP